MTLSITTDYGHIKQGSLEKAFKDKGIHLKALKQTTGGSYSYLSLDDIGRLIETLQLSKELAQRLSKEEVKYLNKLVESSTIDRKA